MNLEYIIWLVEQHVEIRPEQDVSTEMSGCHWRHQGPRAKGSACMLWFTSSTFPIAQEVAGLWTGELNSPKIILSGVERIDWYHTAQDAEVQWCAS